MIANALTSVVLHGGQTRWFLPGALRSGERITCIAKGHQTVAKVPNGPTGTDAFTVGGPQLSIDRRPNGATMIRCGKTVPVFPPKSTMPDVIGPNGLALIRCANLLSRLVDVYGKPSSKSSCGAAGGSGSW